MMRLFQNVINKIQFLDNWSKEPKYESNKNMSVIKLGQH